jgi:hypothetical protein
MNWPWVQQLVGLDELASRYCQRGALGQSTSVYDLQWSGSRGRISCFPLAPVQILQAGGEGIAADPSGASQVKTVQQGVFQMERVS